MYKHATGQNNPPLDRRRPIPLQPVELDETDWVPMALVFTAGIVTMLGVLI